MAQSGIAGKVWDTDTGEEFNHAKITITQEGTFLKNTSTDTEGNYVIFLDPGNYSLEVSYVGYPDRQIQDVEVPKKTIIKLDIKYNDNDLGLLFKDISLSPHYCFSEIVIDNQL